MLINYETASMLLYYQSIIHVVSTAEIDSIATVSVLRRFFQLRLIPFTLAFAPAANAQEGFHVFVNAPVTHQDALVICSATPVPLEYIVSSRVYVLDDGLAMLQFLHIFDSKHLQQMIATFYKQTVKQQASQSALKEADSVINYPTPRQPVRVKKQRSEESTYNIQSYHPRILRIIQENNMIFARKPQQAKEQEQEEPSEEYSVDLDEESSEEEPSAEQLSESMRQFVVETQESQYIDVDIHRRLYNQYQFEDSQMPSTQLAHWNEEDEEEEAAREEELPSESESTHTSATNYERLRQLTESATTNPTRVHPIQFFLDFQPDISAEQLSQLFDRVRRMRQGSNQEQFKQLSDEYHKLVSHGYPSAFKAALTVLSVTSGIDISDKNFSDQVVFTSFVGGVAYYEQHFTDINTIQHYRQRLRYFVVEQGSGAARGRPWLTFTDYNIRALRLVPLFSAIQISSLKSIIRYSNFSVQEATAKANHLLAKLGMTRADAQAVFVTLDKNTKRVFKKNYYYLSQPYRNQYQFYVPNFVYQHSQIKTIEISAYDVACLLQANPQKYAYMDFYEIAFLVQKSAVTLDSVQYQDANYHNFHDVYQFLSRQLFLQSQLQFLKLVYDYDGLLIYNVISDHEFGAIDFEYLSALARQEKIMQDYLTYNKKAPNKLLQGLYEQGQADWASTIRGCRFIKARFKPVDIMAQDCVVCVFARGQCYVNYAKSGFMGAVVGYYVQATGDWDQLNRVLDSEKMGQIQRMFDTWKNK